MREFLSKGWKKDIDRQITALAVMTKKTVDPDAIAPFLGTYYNEVLGDASLVIHDDRSLWIDFGEYETLMRPLRMEENQFILYESLFVGKTLALEMGSDGHPTMVLPGDEATYRFEAIP